MRRRAVFCRPRVTALEERLPPNDALGALWAWAVLGPGSGLAASAARADAAPSGPRSTDARLGEASLPRWEAPPLPVGVESAATLFAWAADALPARELGAEDWNNLTNRTVRTPVQDGRSDLRHQPESPLVRAPSVSEGRPLADARGSEKFALAIRAGVAAVQASASLADNALLARVAAFPLHAPEGGTSAGPSGSYTVTLLGHLHPQPSYAGMWGYAAPDGREYALLGARDGTSIVDVTDPTSPVEVAF